MSDRNEKAGKVNHNSLSCVTRAAMLSAAMLFASAFPVGAQDRKDLSAETGLSAKVDIEYKQASMAAILADISRRYKVSIIADGVPLLQKADLRFEGDLRGALDRIADAFDYGVTVGKTGVVFMVKKFNNPDERPQAIPAEIRQTAADILTILPSVPVDTGDPPSWVTMLRQIGPRVPADLLEKMKGGKRIPLTELPPELQAILIEVIHRRAYGDARSMWDMLYRQMNRLDSSLFRMIKQGVYNREDGASTAYFDIVHEARSPDGTVTKTSLGGFKRELKK